MLSLCLATTTTYAQINIPHWPEDNTLERSADYEVSVRTSNGDWQPLEVLSCQVNLANRSKASFAEFDMGEPVSVRVRRATLWADVAHPVNIGTHGDDRSDKGETLRDVTIEDCDVLYARTNSVLNFSCGDKNWIRDVSFRNIRVERVDNTALIGMAVIFGDKYNRAPGNGIDHVTFENIRFTGDTTQLRPNFFRDYDETHRIGKNIIIK